MRSELGVMFRVH